MAVYVDVIVDISANSLDRTFQYRVPEHMISDAAAGRQVKVPFGKGSRVISGFIISVSDKPALDPARIKDLAEIEKGAPAVESQLIMLADWIRRHYGSTMLQALKTVLPVRRPVRAIRRVTYVLADREGAEALYEKCSKNLREKARTRLLKALLLEEQLPRETVTGLLQISPSTLKAVLKTGVMTETSEQVYRNSASAALSGWHNVTLNADQQAAAEDIRKDMAALSENWEEAKAVHLLYGITGSGKTEVYMDLIAHVLSQGRQVIVLIPEISLTLQTVSRFYARFGSRIAIMNSRLSAGERYDQYMRAKNGEASIMIGPRSALFTPFENLGLIIIDEAHEGAYKSETTPRFHAVDTAIARARLAGAAVVLGSATPSVTSYYKAMSGQYSLKRLTVRAKSGSHLPVVSVVDMREEFSLKNRSILSRPLYEAMKETLARGEQIMLFLNRRGFAGFVSCRSCGHVIQCRHCDVAMKMHYGGRLKCHYCGYEEALPDRCPECGSPYIAGFGIGTQKVEQMVRQAFPEAGILRMDKDTTSGKDDFENILKSFSEHKADILIGTQMIVKGHDFENVTLVGILAADLSMFSGDYLSSERTFQLLTQAAGRAGRGDRPGRVIIQTYQPDHYSIAAAARQDYDGFYAQEICFRQMMHYPPASHMLMLLAESVKDQAADAAMQRIRAAADDLHMEGLQVLGPSRAGLTRGKDLYRYVVYFKHDQESELIRLREHLEALIGSEDMFSHIFFNFDMNPYVLQ